MGPGRYGKGIWIKMARVGDGSRLERMVREGDTEGEGSKPMRRKRERKSSPNRAARRAMGCLVFPVLCSESIERGFSSIPHSLSINNTGSWGKTCRYPCRVECRSPSDLRPLHSVPFKGWECWVSVNLTAAKCDHARIVMMVGALRSNILQLGFK